ncbi:MAG TPA: occlusion derived virus envelope protein 66, partial [Rhodospirillaceae bacterium]|nr:occlusion derived virus envelope protein 66 [Rhodospirillaceae bacterium]
YPSVALRRLLDLREEQPNNAGVAAQIAVVQAKLGNLEEALHFLGIASSMEPNNAGHVYNMAVIADRAGSKSEAVKYYEQALELDSIYGRGETIPRESVYERLANIR